MIVGIGTDLVDIPRVEAFARRWGDGGLHRVFSRSELAYCLSLADPGPSLAARFAAKEAFFKAVGTGWGRGGAWCEIEVQRGDHGRPTLALSGRAAATAGALGTRRAHLSLTHATAVAGAVVVLEA
jgi:holo-[acyl-carrier protein] synthase